MIIELPDTSIPAVAKRIISVRENNGAMALGRVMTLVVITEEETLEPVLHEAQNATRQHPSRIIVVVSGNPNSTNKVDAQVRIGGDAGASEIVVLKLCGELTRHGSAVVLPLLLADSPIVAWWPRTAPHNVAADPIGVLAQRRITDAQAQKESISSMHRRAEHYQPGDTDLAWTRTTRWRGVLASLLEQPPHENVTAATVTGNPDSASAHLLAAWLQIRLQVPVQLLTTTDQEGIYGVTLERPSGTTQLTRPDGITGYITHPGEPERCISLPRRNDDESLADELSRLDADEPYAEALRLGLPEVTITPRQHTNPPA
ncbi:glucose-6-phosphate dehydrogenase assembly protein OpcA [Dermatophilus congolensis]|uniref:glucose-6-phosphate dehydrogenase assembly protein OpcA n=1 Tax=Dermatophilus congolensis TaxID=1863 RepID=UPI001AAE79C4|nr:glucose-6-phosphate dehydrogenase assembly protein OpcA [Dermatophilus congolensis]MBO3129495.1 glucose-6-phosphate dehydrogenase assembly protein OpcA [Dermatophilus congolensis]MBO3131872.1 glucose-6-phosphate dehydrogenase assembly protein OpcA [Dermatophilus congolensis]MBO3133971.1 glucose-6-phosphate dehydrogenase assembly protein OpcA [Dermatophilus congolensis]MBO3136202.1 glucose-6-phosphate dehydrogenase assembly protein OpcA [Dermatophilus congolensis]MBO3138448.1 glucose-6-phosp